MGRYIFCDVETGGLDPKVHGITEIGAVAFDFDPQHPNVVKNTGEFQALIAPNPDLAYTPYALQLQDRTLAYLTHDGVDELYAWAQFETFLRKHAADWRGLGDHIVAHQASFDYAFLSALASRCGNSAAFPVTDRCAWICTKNLFRTLSGLGIVAFRGCGLGDIMRWYGIEIKGKQHNALVDCRAGVEVFRHEVSDLKRYYGST